MKLLVMGATSGIGARVRETALERGHDVRAFARSAESLAPVQKLEPFSGDALNPDDVARALEGCDAVIYALGIKESVAMLWQEVTLFSDSTRILIEAMENTGPRRLIAITGFGAGRSRQAMSFIERTGHKAILGKPYADKDRQEEMIMASHLDWTIARPVILTNNKATGTYRVLSDPATWRNGMISRANVAHYAVRAAEEGLNIREDVVLAR
ncbi:NAD(P)-dependent oxidoreductase [Ovoidimarina sediminis]|uniref:NAD(P)-dependent oxidoreductase n=1 Tax=Ovoidimarina sediminis TaxID=3079856 RepID=UPI00291570E7|nr:NAD(P)-binding oxidoreductase [Rhodophyticola sp. MJ-SS7]MDU8943258.1 NAD(P)-binding oxidoreductase [Rhodophyticola sp. MJ-SS7]